MSFESIRAREVTVQPARAPRVKIMIGDRVARGAHQRHEKMYIVQRQQTQAEHLVRDEEMTEVRAREARARRTRAFHIERPWVVPELAAFDVEPAVAREHRAISSHARRRYA